MMQEAMDAFLTHQLPKFDALVKENACQVRAAKICDLANRLRVDDGFKTQVEQMRKEPDLATQNADIAFLVNSYALTKLKVSTQDPQKPYIWHDEIKREGWSFATKSFVEKTQQRVAQSSVQYVQEKTKALKRSLFPLVSDPCVFTEEGRPVTPCFFSLKLLLKQPTPFVLQATEWTEGKKTGQTAIVYGPSPGKKTPHPILQINGHPALSPEVLTSPSMVIAGYAVKDPKTSDSLVNRIREIPLKNLILWNAAQHPQYAGRHKETPIPFPLGMEKHQEKFTKMQQEADPAGCSAKNPSRFCIDHIYASTLGEALQ